MTTRHVSDGQENVLFWGTPSLRESAPRALGCAEVDALVLLSDHCIPVPAGFATSWKSAAAAEERLPDGFVAGLQRLDELKDPRLRDLKLPLFVSVRTTPLAPVPGLPGEVRWLGVSAASLPDLAILLGGERRAVDAYLQFLSSYGEALTYLYGPRFGDEHEKMLNLLERQRDPASTGDLVGRLQEQLEAFAARTSVSLMTPPEHQLSELLRATASAWQSGVASAYRAVRGMDEHMDLISQVMVMPPADIGFLPNSAVAASRNAASGECELTGWFVSEESPPIVQPLADLYRIAPRAFADLGQVTERCEGLVRYPVQITFVVDDDRLCVTALRRAPLEPAANLRAVAELVSNGRMDKGAAIASVTTNALASLLQPVRKRSGATLPAFRGIGSSGGVVSGRAAFDGKSAEAMAARGQSVVLLRRDLGPEDMPAVSASDAVVTSEGGSASHAAVVARGLGKVLVTACHDLALDAESLCGRTRVGLISQGDWLTVDGVTGEVFLGASELEPSPFASAIGSASRESLSPKICAVVDILSWADEVRTLGVRVNADTPDDAALGRELGADGVGLCRTEHMFFRDGRLTAFQRMLLAPNRPERLASLDELLPMQRDDFAGILTAMHGLPVTVRMLDAPLGEFLPRSEDAVASLSQLLSIEPESLRDRCERLTEQNPMMGNRGCRLAAFYPEITRMQSRALFEAALRVAGDGVDVRLEILVPMVSDPAEFAGQRALVDEVAGQVLRGGCRDLPYRVGAMIETPRAALLADRIVQKADFLSIGTNDLTQATYALSRDDAARIVQRYQRDGLMRADPFEVLDRQGVGRLVEWAVSAARREKPDVVIGVCGEQGGNEESIRWLQDAGVSYVSVTPWRLPLARLSAARAVARRR